jgi:hypothetical protein
MSFRNILLLILGVLIVIAASRFLFSRHQGEMRAVPERYQGEWVTVAEGFSDRFLELRDRSITFGTGGVSSQTFEVTGFDEDRRADGTIAATVYFRSVDGGVYRRQFTYSSGELKSLIFTHQPEVVWVQD